LTIDFIAASKSHCLAFSNEGKYDYDRNLNRKDSEKGQDQIVNQDESNLSPTKKKKKGGII